MRFVIFLAFLEVLPRAFLSRAYVFLLNDIYRDQCCSPFFKFSLALLKVERKWLLEQLEIGNEKKI